MKIEKISDNQIKFTLTREDLASRHLHVSELAYGSERARELFSELMERATTEVGFETEDLPLMIEAIPMASESLVLVVTKMEDPEELDARFSNFTAAHGKPQQQSVPAADEIISCFEHLENLLSKLGGQKNGAAKNAPTDVREADTPVTPEELAEARSSLARIYAFDNLKLIKNLSAVLIPFYKGSNSLYKDPRSGFYYLVLQMSDHTPEEFNKVCNIVSEYGDPAHTSYATMSFFEEHFDVIIPEDALTVLSKI